MRRRKYQITDRLEKKLWEIEQKGAILTTGLQARRNVPMRTGTRNLETEEAAKKEFDRLCTERDSQGWNLLESFDDAKGSRANDAEGARLLDAIIKAPDVLDSYLVYGDWLTERDDPLGEMIATGAQIDKDPKNKKLRAHLKEIVEANARTFLGDLAEVEGCETTWRRGFLDGIEFGVDSPCALDPEEALTTLFGLRVACILRGLALGDFGNESDFEGPSTADYEDLLRVLVQQPLPKTIRRFEVASHRVRINDTDIGDVSIVYKSMPNLRELSLRGMSIELGKISFPELRIFQVKTRSPSTVFIEAVINAKWPKLETLGIDFGKRVGTSITSRAGALVAALPAKLTALSLRGLIDADSVLKAILAGKNLKQLKSIDLARGDLSDDAARSLAKSASKLDHLETLDVSKQEFTRDVVEELQAAFGKRIVVDEGVERRTAKGRGAIDATDPDDDDDGEYDQARE